MIGIYNCLCKFSIVSDSFVKLLNAFSYRSAAKSGFRFVECANPYETPALHIKHLLDQTELKQVLINAPVGKFPGGERGLACLPDRTADFKSSVQKAIEYAKILECPR